MNGDTSKAPRSLQDSFISLDRTLKEVQDLIGPKPARRAPPPPKTKRPRR